jgi:hypothetical protein
LLVSLMSCSSPEIVEEPVGEVGGILMVIPAGQDAWMKPYEEQTWVKGGRRFTARFYPPTKPGQNDTLIPCVVCGTITCDY